MALIGGLPLIELKKLREEEVRVVIEDWSPAKKLIAFQYFKASGLSTENIGNNIDNALRMELKEGNQ